ncbi:hypothetical protein M0R45_000770 [Rubus argutus]|uniref:Uncharacterized protein n=1 Tax=Rubus argutus TaxID=59490 RepID=A0AAW1VP43_RUBAR
MDFYVMKRKKLQQLCKKHGIPANLGNIEMANRLTFLLKVQKQKMKKVSFNPENEIFFFVATPNYSYSGPKKKKRVQKRKSRVKQASKKKQVQLADNARELKLSVTPVRLTRSRAHKMQEGNAEAVCLPCSVRKKVRSGEKTVVDCHKLPPEVKFSTLVTELVVR